MTNPWYAMAEHEESSAMAEIYDRCAPLPAPGAEPALDKFLAEKNLDVSALHRLGARMYKADVLAWPYPQGLKFRDLMNGNKKWSYNGSKFPRMRILRSQQGGADTVLIVEGETDAARATMLYPELDIAMLGAGAKSFTFDMALQVAKYARVLVGLDNDEAAEEGHQKIAGMLESAVRFPPPAHVKDWCEVADGEPIPDPSDTETGQTAPEEPTFDVSGVRFYDLEQIDLEALPEPEWLIPGFVYTEGVHWVDGIPGHGKTSLVMSQCRQLLEAEQHVIWLDWEGGLRATMRRLLATGTKASLIQQCFHYAYNPTKPEDVLAGLMAAWPEALVVLDSCSKALSARGIDENSNTDVTVWTKTLVDFVKSRSNRAVVVIDHVTKNTKDGYSRGAGAKLADTDVSWRVSAEQPFSRDTIGIIKLRLHKDREGMAEFTRYFQVGGVHGLDCQPVEYDEEEGAPTDAQTPEVRPAI